MVTLMLSKYPLRDSTLDDSMYRVTLRSFGQKITYAKNTGLKSMSLPRKLSSQQMSSNVVTSRQVASFGKALATYSYFSAAVLPVYLSSRKDTGF